MAKKAAAKKKRYSVKIRWGSEETRNDSGNPGCAYSFATKVELDAFLAGVDEASGWMDYEIVEVDPT